MEFPKFMELEQDLRRRIWSLAFPDPSSILRFEMKGPLQHVPVWLFEYPERSDVAEACKEARELWKTAPPEDCRVFYYVVDAAWAVTAGMRLGIDEDHDTLYFGLPHFQPDANLLAEVYKYAANGRRTAVALRGHGPRWTEQALIEWIGKGRPRKLTFVRDGKEDLGRVVARTKEFVCQREAQIQEWWEANPKVGDLIAIEETPIHVMVEGPTDLRVPYLNRSELCGSYSFLKYKKGVRCEVASDGRILLNGIKLERVDLFHKLC